MTAPVVPTPVPVLLREGYRLFFPWAAVIGLLSMTAWAAGFAGWVATPFTPQVHAALMLWGAWGALLLGFLSTAFPRQTDGPAPRPAALLALLAAHVGGTVALALPGTGLGKVCVATLPWALATLGAFRLALPALGRSFDGTTAGVPFGLLGGSVAVAAFAAGNTTLGLRLGTHGFLVYLALVMLDRILPFFTARALAGADPVRFRGFAAALGGAVLLRVCVPQQPYLGDLALLVLVTRQWLGWRPWPSSRVPMIGAVHLGVAWVVAGYAVSLAGLGPPSLPYHLWLLGGLGSFWAALSLRVARGHGGLPIRMGVDGAAVVGLVSAAALTRVACTWWPSAWHFAAAGLLLAAAFAVWLWRVGPLVRRG